MFNLSEEALTENPGKEKQKNQSMSDKTKCKNNGKRGFNGKGRVNKISVRIVKDLTTS